MIFTVRNRMLAAAKKDQTCRAQRGRSCEQGEKMGWLLTHWRTLSRYSRATWATRPSRLRLGGPSDDPRSCFSVKDVASCQPLFGSKALKEGPPSDWEGAPLMGMVPVGGQETQRGSEQPAHGPRQLMAGSACRLRQTLKPTRQTPPSAPVSRLPQHAVMERYLLTPKPVHFRPPYPLHPRYDLFHVPREKA